jgi:arylsulfatase A-like enzyme
MKYYQVLLLSAICLLGKGLAINAQEKPNLVFVFADQLRHDVLGYAGDSKAITPNIDKFSEQAVNFTNAVSVSPVCAPFRSSLLTGKYVSSTGMVVNEINMNLNHKTIANVLNDAGYNCAYVGKMHLNDQHKRSYAKGPERFGFDHYWAGYSFHHRSYQSYYYTDDDKGDEYKVDLTGKYGPEEFTTLACNYIEEASKEDKPFTLFLSWNPPHDPWKEDNVPAHCLEKFKDQQFDLPENFKETPDQYMDRYPGEFFKGDSVWKEKFISEGGFQEMMRVYYGMVNSIDEQMGRVIKTIDSLGIGDNTIVVFTSDHGEMFCSQGRMYKLIFYEEAARIPMLIRYPKVSNGGKSDVCLNTPDIMPTLLGLMGLADNIPEEVEGIDLSFAVKGEKGVEPEFAFMQGMGHTFRWLDGFEWRSIRDKRYTYARYLRDGKELLFDNKKDPFQKSDVAADDAYSDVIKRMRKQMQNKMNLINDEFKPCSWYRDNWIYKDFSIAKAAQGKFGPIPVAEPKRTK